MQTRKAVWTWRANESLDFFLSKPNRVSIQSSVGAGTQQSLKLHWRAKVRYLKKERLPFWDTAEKGRQCSITERWPCDCWLYSTIILGIKKIEAQKVYQWFQVHLREPIKHLHIWMLTGEGECGRGHTYSCGGDNPRTGKTPHSNISSPNSEGLCNRGLQ